MRRINLENHENFEKLAKIQHNNKSIAQILQLKILRSPFQKNQIEFIFASAYEPLSMHLHLSVDSSRRHQLAVDFLRGMLFFEETHRHLLLTVDDLSVTGGRLVIFPRNCFSLLEDGAENGPVHARLERDIVDRSEFLRNCACLCIKIQLGDLDRSIEEVDKNSEAILRDMKIDRAPGFFFKAVLQRLKKGNFNENIKGELIRILAQQEQIELVNRVSSHMLEPTGESQQAITSNSGFGRPIKDAVHRMAETQPACPSEGLPEHPSKPSSKLSESEIRQFLVKKSNNHYQDQSSLPGIHPTFKREQNISEVVNQIPLRTPFEECEATEDPQPDKGRLAIRTNPFSDSLETEPAALNPFDLQSSNEEQRGMPLPDESPQTSDVIWREDLIAGGHEAARVTGEHRIPVHQQQAPELGFPNKIMRLPSLNPFDSSN